MPDDGDIGRVLWRSRRGMLELDLVLVDFARRCYPSLRLSEQWAYRRLLELDDWVIWAYLRGARAVPVQFAVIVHLVKRLSQPAPR